jgi:hypothetical protein
MTNVKLLVKVIPDHPCHKKLQLDQNDILKVFSNYGEINDINIDSQHSCAYVTFCDVLDAFMAKMQLHGMRLTRTPACLHVECANLL